MRLVMENGGRFSGVDEHGRPFQIDVGARLEVVVGAPIADNQKTTEDHHRTTTGDHRGHHRAERESTTAQSQSLSLSVDSDSDSPLVPSSPPTPDWWEARADFEVLHRKFRWTREPRGPTLHLLDRMAGHAMTGSDETAGQRWVAAQLESLNGTKSRKVVEYVHEHRFTPLLAETPAPPPQPVPVVARSGGASAIGTSVRDVVLAQYRELIERGEATELVQREYERLRVEQPQGP